MNRLVFANLMVAQKIRIFMKCSSHYSQNSTILSCLGPHKSIPQSEIPLIYISLFLPSNICLFVGRLATGWTVLGSNPGEERDFPHLSRPGLGPTQPPCTMGTGSFQGLISGRGVRLTPHPLLMPWSCKGRAIPLLPLWAVRPVKSLSVCTGVYSTLHFHACLQGMS